MPSQFRPVRHFLALAAASLVACKGTEPPTPTTVVISPNFATFSSVGDTVHLGALVRDQRGDSMPGVTVTWSSNASLVATVSGTGLVTAVANGTAQVTAMAGNASASITVNVAQVAAGVVKTGGDQQFGTVGQALSLQLRVRVNDSRGNAIPNAPVTWAVAAGGGSISGSNADANGAASATWTLGTTAGSGQASATSGSASATFTATQSAGPAAGIAATAGDNQSATVSTAVAIAPRARLTDQFGNRLQGIVVSWAVTSGGGSVSPTSSTTDANGEATVSSWTLGSSGGTNTLTATTPGVSTPATFTATATVAGAPANIQVAAGGSQTALAGYAVNIRPAARVTDNAGQPVAGVQVTFAVASGGGSVTGAVATTGAYGIAQVGSWLVQLGTNTLTATATGGGISGNPVTFTATGASPTFTIELQNFGPAVSGVVQAAFDSATAKWQRIIYQDIPDFPSLNSGAGQCGPGSPAVGPRAVDDVLIIFKVDSIDGPGRVLGFAGPCWIRNPGFLPIMGTMVFDSADIQTLISGGHMNEVILHEMGHVLGFGTLWDPTLFNCIQNPSSSGSALDTYYGCASGRAAFDSIGGLNYTGGSKVPLENCGTGAPSGCGSGTFNSHWREAVFGNELMTGFINSGANPLSVLSSASMEDMGYVVNYAGSDSYSRTFSVQSVMSVQATPTDLGDDIYRGPIYVVDSGGRMVRVIQPR